MNVLKLVTLGLLISFAVPVPTQAQTESSEQPVEPLTQENFEPNQTEGVRLSGELSEPLEVNQQQADEFFTPPQRPQIIENQTLPASEDEELIGPPPGSQTPAEVTPTRQLSIPIQ